MKAYCISDNTDTLMGMRLAGFEGIVLHERQEILDKINNLFLGLLAFSLKSEKSIL